MTLDEARENIGASVVYIGAHDAREYGVISSVRQHFVFVRYGTDDYGKATYPEDLELATASLPGASPSAESPQRRAGT